MAKGALSNRVVRLVEGFWFAPAPASRLAVLRILVGVFSFCFLYERYEYFVHVAGSSPTVFAPVGVVSFLEAPLPVWLFEGLLTATLLFNVLFVAGIRFRYSGPIFAALLLWVISYRHSWSMVYHSQNLVVLHVIVIGLTPAANALSFDAWVRRRASSRWWLHGTWPPTSSSDDWRFGWPVRLICSVTIIAYFLAGVAKVAGPLGWGWAAGTSLRDQVIHDGIRKEMLTDGASPLVFALYDQLWLFTLLGVLTLVLEIGAPLALLKRLGGQIWALLSFGMHWGIYFIMGIEFEYPLWGVLFLSFFAVERPVSWLATQLGRVAERVGPRAATFGRRIAVFGTATAALTLAVVLLGRYGETRSAPRVDSGGPRSSSASTADPTVARRSGPWFEELGAGITLDADELRATLTSVAESLSRGEPRLSELPQRVANDSEARIVFITASDGVAPARVGFGAAAGLPSALEQALAAFASQPIASAGNIWLKLDLVDAVGPVSRLDPRQRLTFDPSLEGVAFSAESGLALLPEELVVRALVDGNVRLRFSAISEYARGQSRGGLPRMESDGSLTFRRFVARSFFFDGQSAHRLRRGHLVRTEITRDRLLDAARAGGRYLERAVLDDGRFVYSYLPKAGAATNAYNMVRHAGTIYSMLELYGVERQPSLLAAAERAIRYLLEHVEPFGDGEGVVLAFGGKIKLGGVALAAVALSEHVRVTGDQAHLDVVRRLCRYILDSQLPSGEFIHQRAHPGHEILDFVSLYYPGEALLALLRYHRADPALAGTAEGELLLDAAERGARYLIEVRDRDVPLAELPHDHWLVYALNELYRARPRPLYLEQSLKIVDAIRSKQRRESTIPDLIGSYYDPPRTAPTATRSEALLTACRVARHAGREDDARDLFDVAKPSLGFQLSTQVDAARALYLPNPQNALGGFTRGLTNYEIRIDYVQHNISAFLLALSELEAANR